jgi:hypothetical protein
MGLYDGCSCAPGARNAREHFQTVLKLLGRLLDCFPIG